MVDGDVRTVLLVEDEPANRALVAATLSRSRDGRVGELELIEADTLRSARAVLATTPVDLVLLDIRLPDGSGLDLIDEIALRPAAKRPRIAIMSASVLPQERETFLASGADTFLGKPCRPIDLMDAIAGLLGASAPSIAGG
ncbi:MAG: response regulator [Chloroflexi bacterium]|nr:MAG: response regulator [Chloroflexota bacterium]